MFVRVALVWKRMFMDLYYGYLGDDLVVEVGLLRDAEGHGEGWLVFIRGRQLPDRHPTPEAAQRAAEAALDDPKEG